MAAVHAPFGLNYRHASNRGEAATSAARRQRHARAGRKNGNEAASAAASVLATIAATLAFGPARTGHRNEIFFEKCALEGREGGRKEMAKTDITLITVGILGRAASAPAGLLCIGLKPSRRGGSGGVVVASCHQNHPSTEKGEEGEMTFRFTFLPSFLCRQQQQQQDSARNALTHPRSALDENSLVRPRVRRRRPHSALRPLVDSEGGEERLPLRFVGGSQGKTVTTYKQRDSSPLPLR